jgi:hypothetical protein
MGRGNRGQGAGPAGSKQHRGRRSAAPDPVEPTPEAPATAVPAAEPAPEPDDEIAVYLAALEARAADAARRPRAGAVPVGEAAELLQVPAPALAELLVLLAEVLPAPPEAGGVPVGWLGPLAAAARWRDAGLDREELCRRTRELLEAAGRADEAAAGSEPVLAPDPTERVLEEVQRLHQVLERSEARWSEDRDRLLVALMRTQQELQSLRVEVSPRSRRHRRRGLLGRLLG